MPQPTIAAISTPAGSGGIGIVRLSGPDALRIGGTVFRARSGRELETLGGYSAALGKVYDERGRFDDAIATVFRAPRSYTGEDVLELSCHGGGWVLRKLLALCIQNGAALAAPGEFTRRAFLNGKLDLAQAEAVMAIISAQGDAALKSAMQAREGALSRAVDGIAAAILAQAAHLAAWVDYPEEDVEELDSAVLTNALRAQRNKITELLDTFEQGRVVREGVSAVIVGKPNVGKSTLMNALAGLDRSIVTDTPGTTRDVVTEQVRVGDLTLSLSDTAGIRDAVNEVEQLGVERAKALLHTAQLVLALFDGSAPLDAQDRALLDLVSGLPVLAVVNKTDKPRGMDAADLASYTGRTVFLSARTGEGIEELKEHIAELAGLHGFDPLAPVVFTQRQRGQLLECRRALDDALAALAAGMTLDAVGACVDLALDALLSLTGRRASDTVVDEVFANFCVGK